jgi:DNA-binding NarL/FixJ family response regulator
VSSPPTIDHVREARFGPLAGYLGYEVVGETSDGNDAVKRVGQLRPHLVALDLRTLRMDGITVTALIKTRWPTVRVIAHSLAVERRDKASAAESTHLCRRPDELPKALRI